MPAAWAISFDRVGVLSRAPHASVAVIIVEALAWTCPVASPSATPRFFGPALPGKVEAPTTV
jgi:hypothetical protein